MCPVRQYWSVHLSVTLCLPALRFHSRGQMIEILLWHLAFDQDESLGLWAWIDVHSQQQGVEFMAIQVLNALQGQPAMVLSGYCYNLQTVEPSCIRPSRTDLRQCFTVWLKLITFSLVVSFIVKRFFWRWSEEASDSLGWDMNHYSSSSACLVKV